MFPCSVCEAKIDFFFSSAFCFDRKTQVSSAQNRQFRVTHRIAKSKWSWSCSKVNKHAKVLIFHSCGRREKKISKEKNPKSMKSMLEFGYFVRLGLCVCPTGTENYHSEKKQRLCCKCELYSWRTKLYGLGVLPWPSLTTIRFDLLLLLWWQPWIHTHARIATENKINWRLMTIAFVVRHALNQPSPNEFNWLI